MFDNASSLLVLFFVCASVSLNITSLVLIHRNRLVSRYRFELLEKVSIAARIDVLNGMPPEVWRLRYTAFGKVAYNDMVRQFWRRPESFYPDQRFTEPDSYPDWYYEDDEEEALTDD